MLNGFVTLHSGLAAQAMLNWVKCLVIEKEKRLCPEEKGKICESLLIRLRKDICTGLCMVL